MYLSIVAGELGKIKRIANLKTINTSALTLEKEQQVLSFNLIPFLFQSLHPSCLPHFFRTIDHSVI